MINKLESIQKIMLATGTINYMASAINSVNEQAKMIPQLESTIAMSTILGGINERDELLSESVIKLHEVMELLGDYMNGADCISPIDVRATEQAFLIVSGENDDVED